MSEKVRGLSKVCLFDLDNTLRHASLHIFYHINRAMTVYIGKHLGVDESEASHIRQDYWRRYGATLLWLIRHHGTLIRGISFGTRTSFLT